MKIACLFAGQGAQYPGMGRDLYEKYPKSRQVFDAAGDRIKNLCFEGTAEELDVYKRQDGDWDESSWARLRSFLYYCR